ncbi:MAG: hypothetical protein HQL75_05185 [Magnetococcales bacterium]|nr:hypothetical protein [Magnetococcales bacterium]MBF0603066.1 hypothetical protein [Magnetococcales bacterium]HAT49581.1 hypothetical protein [Alphaproteobacteria bacterium]
MDDHGTNAATPQGGSEGQHGNAGQSHLENLIGQLEIRWGRMMDLIGRLRDENAFLQEQLREREEKSGTFESRYQEANQRVAELVHERDQLAGRMESLLARVQQFENTH